MRKMVGWMLAAVVMAGGGGVWAQVDESVRQAQAELAARQAEAVRLAAEKAAADDAVAKAEAMVKEAAARARSAPLPQAAAGTWTAAPVVHSGVKGVEVYRSDFGKAVGAEWSKTTVGHTPVGQRAFLGPFGKESVTLALNNLPEHGHVRLSFDLMTILTWDGDSDLDQPTDIGPDLFDVTVNRGPRLLHASFKCGTVAETMTQSFPGRFPYDHFPQGVGAKESGTLGYHYEEWIADHVYQIERTFGHQGKSMTIAFSGIHLQDVTDECWGLENVRVEVLPAVTKGNVEEEAFGKWWTDLGSGDWKAFVPAIDGMIDVGDPAVAAIRKQLATLTPVTEQDQAVAQLIARLDDDAYAVREKASAGLRELGAAAEPALRAARKKATSPEVCTRIDALLAALQEGEMASEGGRRMLRLVEVLERMGTEEARAGLGEIAARTGTLAAWEAEGALKRLVGKAEIPTELDLPPGLPKRKPSLPSATPPADVLRLRD